MTDEAAPNLITMDVRTQKNTLILLSDLSGFHVEDLDFLRPTKVSFPAGLTASWLCGVASFGAGGPSGSCGGGCSAELGASARALVGSEA